MTLCVTNPYGVWGSIWISLRSEWVWTANVDLTEFELNNRISTVLGMMGHVGGHIPYVGDK